MSDVFYKFLTDTFGEKNISLCKHKTKVGDFLGWKYFINLPNTHRPSPVEVIEFTDGLYYCGICAWIDRETMQDILLVLKKRLIKEQADE